MREAEGVAAIRRSRSPLSCRNGRQSRWVHSPRSPQWRQGRGGSGPREEWRPLPPAPGSAAVCASSSPTHGWQIHRDLQTQEDRRRLTRATVVYFLMAPSRRGGAIKKYTTLQIHFSNFHSGNTSKTQCRHSCRGCYLLTHTHLATQHFLLLGCR